MLILKETSVILNIPLTHSTVGIGVPEINGVSRFTAVFLCAKSQFIIMLDWVRQLKNWLGSLIPVRQPYSVRLHNWRYVVWLKTLSTEAIMPKTYAQKPTNSVSLKSLYLLLDSNKNLITSSLTIEQVKPISERIKGSIIKFQAMIRVEVSA